MSPARPLCDVVKKPRSIESCDLKSPLVVLSHPDAMCVYLEPMTGIVLISLDRVLGLFLDLRNSPHWMARDKGDGQMDLWEFP